MSNTTSLALAAIATLSLCLPAQAWPEVGDAGDLPANCQIPCGTGPLTTITGAITPSDVDMYLIRVDDPSTFVANTCAAAGSLTDTRLFLFRPNGTGLAYNDDACGLKSVVTGTFLPGPGVYLLAVCGFANMALDSGGQDIWNLLPSNTERAPDGPGAAGTVTSWSGAAAMGTYQIDLSGATYVNCASCTSTGTGCGGLTLVCGSLPRVGSVLSFTLSGLPAVGIGTAVLRFGPTVPGVPLAPPFDAGCTNYMGPAPSLSLPITVSPSTNYVLTIPAAPGFVGLPIAVQGLSLDILAFVAYSSNALDARIGG